MTTSNTTLISRSNETTTDTPKTDAQRQLDGSGAPWSPSPEFKELWTDGSADPAKIKHRMEQLATQYVSRRWQTITTGQFRFEREIQERKRIEREFYGHMHYLEDLLYAAPVLPLQAESTTTIAPYEPARKKRRGRPATGIKPRDRRVNKDDDSY